MNRTPRSTFRSADGRLVAAALAGSWRLAPPPLEVPARELERLAPLLLKSGSAALIWWRAKNSAPSLRLPADFHRAFKLQTLEAELHELRIQKVFGVLNRAGIDAALVKGWAVARHYPRPGLRPYGDLDICVPAEQFDLAARLLGAAETQRIWIDLHRGFAALDSDGEFDSFERLHRIRLGNVRLCVPSTEDHLRMLCLHLLRHGGWRPVWLCDIAVALEAAAGDFDWSRFYGRNERRAVWLACVVGLARKLLGARVDDSDSPRRSRTPPRWLVNTVLCRWGRWFNGDYRDAVLASLLRNRSRPVRMLEDLYFRFDPLRATVETNGSFNEFPRLPYQVAAVLRRALEAPRYVKNLVRTHRA